MKFQYQLLVQTQQERPLSGLSWVVNCRVLLNERLVVMGTATRPFVMADSDESFLASPFLQELKDEAQANALRDLEVLREAL